MNELIDQDVESMKFALLAAREDTMFRKAREMFSSLPFEEQDMLTRMATAAVEHFGYLPSEVKKRHTDAGLNEISSHTMAWFYW